MQIRQLRIEIDQVEKHLFFDSLYKLPKDVLLQIQENVKRLKENFIKSSFQGYSVEDIDYMRFQLEEMSISLDIRIKEELGEDFTEEVIGLTNLYQIAKWGEENYETDYR